MLYPPDLSLASSYIPACVCVLKGVMAFVLFVLSPLRGWIGICCLLTTDRVLWNQPGLILDVNAVVGALVGGLMVVRARGDGVHTVLQLPLVGAWALFCACQIVGLTRLPKTYEVIFAGGAISVLSCLHQTQERIELCALRAFVFLVLNIVLPYLAVMMQQSEIDTYVNLCRTALLLLAEPEQAAFWFAAYLLCIGYQVRSRRPETRPSPPPVQQDEEAAQLKEALKSRQVFRDA